VSDKQILPDFPCTKYNLENGLEVILLEDHRLPLVAINIGYHVGPVNERPGLTGFAHLFEHMMFEGSKHVGEKAHILYLEAAGASTINGTTGFDRTNYYETLPSNQLELALWLESDRMGFLLDNLNDRLLENQRDVVRNERRQVVESAPYGLVHEELFHQLFPSPHPYYASVMGSHADIEAAELEDVRNFFGLFYAPNNACLSLVGDFNTDKAKLLIEKYFGPIPSGAPIPPISVPTPLILAEKRAVVEDQVELPQVTLAWITAPILTQEDAECDLLARIIGGGKSSRLYQRLVYEQRIAQNIGAQQASLALGSIFAIEGTCKPGVSPQQLEDAMRKELELFQQEGPRQEELERARNTMEASILRSLENLGGFANRLNLYNHYLGKPQYLSDDLMRYHKVTIESLRAIACSALKRESGVTIWGVPGTKVVQDVPKSVHPLCTTELDGASIPDQDWRSAPPLPGPTPTLELPIPQKFQLPNGLNVFLVEQHNLPIVSISIISISGSDRNPIEHPGLASFTAEMLDEGTLTRSPLKIAADADQIGASLASSSSTDFAYVASRMLKRNLDAAFELVTDILLNPVFAPHEIERIRHDRLTQILQQKDNPGVLASKFFFNAVYGSSHPYGFIDVGTEESNKAITQDLLAGFYRAGYFATNSALVVAGDITDSELRVLSEKFLGNWNGKGSVCEPPQVMHKPLRRIVIVDRPEASQTVLRIGHIGVPHSHPDYAAIDVMNTALGGLYSSRINQNLRQKHGYTYGASSAFFFRRGSGPFLIGTSVQTGVTAPAVMEIFNEIDRIRQEEITAEELTAAKDSIIRSLPGQFETTPESASSIGQLFVHNLPLTYYNELPTKIGQVTAGDVQRAAQTHLKPEEMVIVAVGDRRLIEMELDGLALGPIEVYTP
jgi:zinc protease